jgi:hypothetical protein
MPELGMAGAVDAQLLRDTHTRELELRELLTAVAQDLERLACEHPELSSRAGVMGVTPCPRKTPRPQGGRGVGDPRLGVS